MPIPKIPARVRNYLFTFGSTSIAVTRRGAVLLTANPEGHESAWWLKREVAKTLLNECFIKGDIEAAAARLNITLTPFEVGVMKADKALKCLDDILQQAQASGDLKRFNAIYRARRILAQALGTKFMSYRTAQERLKRSLVAAIADGTQGRPFSFAVSMARVFDQ
jgi:hypothetical protein